MVDIRVPAWPGEGSFQGCRLLTASSYAEGSRDFSEASFIRVNSINEGSTLLTAHLIPSSLGVVGFQHVSFGGLQTFRSQLYIYIQAQYTQSVSLQNGLK